MKLNCYCGGQRSAVRILYISALLLLTGFLSAYGANDLAVGVKNSTYYFDRQSFFIDQDGRLNLASDKSLTLANNFTQQFSPSSSDLNNVVGSVITGPGEITIFASENALNSNVMLAISGHGIISPTLDGKQSEFVQYSSVDLPAPYHIWNLGQLSGKLSGWKLSAKYQGLNYYEKTVRVDNLNQDCRIWAFVDNDNDSYYSKGELYSGANYQTTFLVRPIKLMKDYNGPYDFVEINTASAVKKPCLVVHSDTLTPLADDTTDVVLNLPGTQQTWSLIAEFAGWKDVNRLGYYTDLDTGLVRSLIFRGPDNAGITKSTTIIKPVIGLWLLNDTNGDTVFNGDDSFLFSQRRLTAGSMAQEHQWFKIYDVSAFKGLGYRYYFYAATGNYNFVGNFDYLLFIDDDHTSADWDHNDMIVGILCNRPPVATCPNDTTILKCSLGQVSLHGFSATDPDGNFDTAYAVGGTFRGDSVYFTPGSAGTYTLKLIAKDKLGLADTCQTQVTVNLNHASDAISPNDTTISMCSLGELRIPGFRATDLDNNITSVTVTPGALRGDTLYFTPVAGVNNLKIVATDACGAKDSSITRVTVILNSPPDAVSPNDTTIFMCALGELRIPGFIATDPNNNISSVTVIPGTLHGDTLYFTPTVGLNTCKIVVTDACGAKDSSITRVTVNLNSPPDAQSPGDETVFHCSLTEIRLPGFLATDPDNNISSVVVTPGTLHGDTLYFTPVEGLNILKIVVTDACGAKDSSITRKTVNINHLPDAISPSDTTIPMCSLGELRIPGFRATDPNNNISSVTVTPGTLHGDTLYFTPTAGLNTCKIVVTDACGTKDSSITRVTVNLNSPPDAVSPNDTTIFMCALGELRIPGFRATDPNNNISSITVTPGTLHGDTLYFTPTAGLNTCKIVVADACGAKDSSITRVTVNLNSAPDAISPNDTTIFMCALGELRIPGFRATDPNGNISSITVTPGTLHGDTLYFTPTSGLNTCKIVVTDACGAKDSSITRVTVNLNSAPDAISPNDTTIFMCALGELRIPGFRATDPNGNISSITVTPGTLHGDTLYFTPTSGLNTCKIVVTDACGAKDSSITRVTVNLNSAPDAISPNDTTIFMCALGELRIPGFRATDPNGNISSITVTPGTLHGDTLYFTPTSGLNTCKIVVTDACGAKDSSITRVTVNLNSAPDAISPNDTTIFMCALGELRIPGFRATDPNNNISSVTVTPGTLHGDTLYFTPTSGLNTCKIVVTDACGAKDSSITRVTVNLNSAPDAISPNDTTIFMCALGELRIPGFRATDPNGNISSITVTPGTLHGDTLYFTPTAGLNTCKIVVTDACGAKDSSITRVTVNLNNPPVVVAPHDTTIFRCDATGTYKVDGFVVSDVDGNLPLANITATGGTFNSIDTSVSIVPTAGPHIVILTATDNCGSIKSDTLVVTVNLNNPPVVVAPHDTTIFRCDATGTYKVDGFVVSDVDGNLPLANITATGGTFNSIDTSVSIVPTAGPHIVILTATDNCVSIKSDTVVVTVNLNNPPVVVAPHDTTIFRCDATGTYKVDGFVVSDVDGNLPLANITATGGTFNSIDTSVSIVPTAGPHIVILTATDNCVSIKSDTVVVTVNLNNPPVVVAPHDTTIFRCDATGTYKVDGFVVSDVDGNLPLANITATGGTFNSIDTSVSIVPTAGPHIVILTATDNCGSIKSDTVVATVNLNNPPVVVAPHDTTINFNCIASQICLGPFSASDADNNIDTAYILANGYGGTFNGTTYCFTPTGAGTFTIKYYVLDECGKSDTSITIATVNFVNRPPVVNCHADTTITVCNLSAQICLSGFAASDPDGNLASKTVTGGTLAGSTVCFTPIGGLNSIRMIATDSCGLADTCFTQVNVIVNSAPTVSCPGNSNVSVDSLNQICISGFTANDINGNLASRIVIGGTLRGDTVCFTPVRGLNTLTFIAVDSCGLADTCQTQVNVTVNNMAPVIHASISDVCVAQGEQCYPFYVTDDGIGTIVVTSTAGIITMDSTKFNAGVSSAWYGKICFNSAGVCGENWVNMVTINATDGSDPAIPYTFGPVTVSGVITVSMPHANWFWPGFVDSIPVTMDAANCFCMGGFELTVMYDASIFNVIRVVRGNASADAEYFYTNYNPPVAYCIENAGRTGALKVVMIWDLNDQNTNPGCAGDSGNVLFWIVGQVPNGDYQANFCVQICFYSCGLNNGCTEPGFVFDYNAKNYQWNAITDKTGNLLWKTEGCCDASDSTGGLVFDCGNIKINGNVPPGDVNGNDQPYEIGDVVALANFLNDPVGYPLTRMEWWSSDINQDGLPASIADLVMLIRIVTNQTPIPNHKIAPIDVTAEVSLTGNNVTITADANLGGAVVTINHTGEIGVPTANGMDIKYSDKNGVLTVVAYSLAGNAFGNKITIDVPIVSGTATLASASVADINGAMLNSKLTAPLPEAFALIGSYPNPFNSTTIIEFGLPSQDIVALKIYDLVGRLVTNVDLGQLDAGYHNISWNGTNSGGNRVASGIYFAKLESVKNGTISNTQKMVLIK